MVLLILQHQHVHGQLLLGSLPEFLISQGEDVLQGLSAEPGEAGSLSPNRSKDSSAGLLLCGLRALPPPHSSLVPEGPWPDQGSWRDPPKGGKF